MAPPTMRTLSTIPDTPKTPFIHHIALYLAGFFISIHIRQGYAKVMGNAIPPSSPARLGKKGSAIDMKNARHPKKMRRPVRSHRGHGLCLLLVYIDSRLSNTGIAYIWNELKLLMTMSRLAKTRTTLDVLRRWYLYRALRMPSFAGI